MPPGGQGRKVITATLAALLRWWEGFRNRDHLAAWSWCQGRGAACGLVAWTVAAPGPPCHCGAVNAGPVSAGARRVCLLLAIAGSVLLMSGVLLVAGSGVLGDDQSRGWRPATLIALGLIASGLFCGAVIVAIAVPGSRRAIGRTRPPPRAARPGRPARLLPRPAPETMPGPEAWPASAPPPAQAGWPAPKSPPPAGAPVPQARAAAEAAPPAPEAQPAPAPRPAPRQPPEARPAPEEEWMQALRPDGPPPIRRPPPQPGSDPG